MPETPVGIDGGHGMGLQKGPNKRLGSGAVQVAGTKTREEKYGLGGGI